MRARGSFCKEASATTVQKECSCKRQCREHRPFAAIVALTLPRMRHSALPQLHSGSQSGVPHASGPHEPLRIGPPSERPRGSQLPLVLQIATRIYEPVLLRQGGPRCMRHLLHRSERLVVMPHRVRASGPASTDVCVGACEGLQPMTLLWRHRTRGVGARPA